jgi:hypothetical protein
MIQYCLPWQHIYEEGGEKSFISPHAYPGDESQRILRLGRRVSSRALTQDPLRRASLSFSGSAVHDFTCRADVLIFHDLIFHGCLVVGLDGTVHGSVKVGVVLDGLSLHAGIFVPCVVYVNEHDVCMNMIHIIPCM